MKKMTDFTKKFIKKIATALAQIGQGYSPSRRDEVSRQNWWGMLNFVSKFFSKKFRQNMANERGVTMLLTMIILAVVLATAIAAAGVVVMQIRLAGNAADSVGAIFAADAGVEWQLYNIRHSTTTEPVMVNGSTFLTSITWGSPTVLKSLGTFRSAKRQFRLTF